MNTGNFDSDYLTKKDLVGRKQFAEDLAEDILNSFPNKSECMVIGMVQT
ncbi:MAG: hypothetical protein ACJARP_001264 [Vicingaceae bacterium]|jgi:hypothetical protein